MEGYLADVEADASFFAADWPHVGTWTHTVVPPGAAVPQDKIVFTIYADLSSFGPEAQNALAFHSVDQNGVPFAAVGYHTCQDNGVDWRTGADHELKELLADPPCTVTATDPAGRQVAFELCDPVEGHSYRAGPNGSPLSNYVKAAWFGQANPDGSNGFDRMGEVSGAWEIAADGYAVVGNADVTGPTQAFEADHVKVGHDLSPARRANVEALARAGLSPRRKPRNP